MKFYYLLLIGLLFLSCSHPKRTPYLSYYPDSNNIFKAELYRFDSAYVFFDQAQRELENNSWAFRKDTVPGGIYQLRINDQEKIPLILEGVMPVTIADKENKLTISGNSVTKQLWQARSLMQELNDTIQSLGESFPDSLKSAEFTHYKDSVFGIILMHKKELQKKIMHMIDRNKDNLLPLFLVQMKAGNHYLFDFKNDANTYFTVDEYLQSYNAGNTAVRQFNRKIDSLRSWIYYTSVTLPGKSLPDISVPNAWGDPIPLSRFTGNNTLYVVWNSNSEESRNITRQLMKWTRPYRNKGLDLCLISTDNNKEEWQTAIKEDNLPVWHLSDLKGKQSPVLAGLGITKIPTFILVDKEGIILERSSEQSVITKALDQLIKK